jgi:thiol-disulfide isomerase/thioredoxin
MSPRRFVAALALACGGCLAVIATMAPTPAAPPAGPTAAPAPAAPPAAVPKSDPYLDLVAEDPHGRPLHFKDFAGKIRIIDLWATWCGPCRMTIPELNALYDRHRGHGVVVIGISVDDDSAAVLEFQAQVPMRYPTAMFNPSIAALFGQPGAIPTTYLVDRSGKVKRRYVGYVDAATLEADLARLL